MATLRAQPVAFIAVPIKVGGETIGVLSVDRLFAERVSFEEDVRVLSIVASLIGQAVNLQQHVVREREGLLEQTRSLQQALHARYRLESVVGQSKRMREIYEAIHQVSQSRATVLLRGESGTGKELLARAIHYNSPRAGGPFIKINCAALPQTLLESELFGHEKGAFTGATATKKGRFELADDGTLFLDEIGDLPLDLQAKLLRVLQERSFERVGGTQTVAVDVRIVAATHQDLEAAIAAGKFREDLYYRLNVVPILLPPLRERREDIPLLTEHFLAKYNRENNRKVRITGRALQEMLDYDWPGNVRELENCIERLVIMSRRRLILPEDLLLPVDAEGDHAERGAAPAKARSRSASAAGGALPLQPARYGTTSDPPGAHPSRRRPGQGRRSPWNHPAPACLPASQTPDRQIVPARQIVRLLQAGRAVGTIDGAGCLCPLQCSETACPTLRSLVTTYIFVVSDEIRMGRHRPESTVSLSRLRQKDCVPAGSCRRSPARMPATARLLPSFACERSRRGVRARSDHEEAGSHHSTPQAR